MRVPLLLNWYLNPYHAPLIVAKKLGFYDDVDIQLELLEPTDPSDVTYLVGRGEIALGLKAMVHCYAANARGLPIRSIGTLLDEPPTGLISLKSSQIDSLADIRGKRIGYVGEFGKVMVENLATDANIGLHEFTTHRIGMHAARALLEDKVDTAIGLSCFQQLEVEQHFETQFHRIDELAGLGCCCFCSIMLITHDAFMKNEPELLKQFMRATRKGSILVREHPELAFETCCEFDPKFNTALMKKIFTHCLPFFSRDLSNNPRDWQKVGQYAKKIGIADPNIQPSDCYSNNFNPCGISENEDVCSY